MDQFLTSGVVWAAESASSSTATLEAVWPYLAISVLLTLSLIGTAFKILRNQKD
jgi:hypothetical protein